MNLKEPRKSGDEPFRVAVLHGGPGLAGEVKPVVEELSSGRGVLEPFQTELTIEEQVDELRDTLEKFGDLPMTLIGHSWGAWLGIIFAAIYPGLAEKIILVGSPPFREKYAEDIEETRLKRLKSDERREAENLLKDLNKSDGEISEEELRRLGELFHRSDSFDPISSNIKLENVDVLPEVYQNVWSEAREVRKSGELLELARLIEPPVVAIHGDYDPHPAEGVREPLSSNIKDFKFILLKNCGHVPWLERQAKDKFYIILEGLIGPDY